jgi:hypothetical protein
MPTLEPQVLIFAAEPARRSAILAALAHAGLAVRHQFVAELSDLVFAVVGGQRPLAVVDLHGQSPMPPAISTLLHNLAPGTVLVAVDDGAASPAGFDHVTPLAGLGACLQASAGLRAR